MSMSIGVQEHLLEGSSLTEKFEFARAAGFDGIELRGTAAIGERLSEVREARRAGVTIPSVCALLDCFIGDADPSRRRSAVRDLKVLLSVIVEAGGYGVVTPASYGLSSRYLPPFEPPVPDGTAREILAECLVELGEHAAEVGGMVLLEPLNRYEDYMVNTLAQAAALVSEIGMASVGMMADTFHMSIEEADPGMSLRRHGALVKHVHLGDTNRLEPGSGHYDWSGTLSALEEVGYEGWMVMECSLSGPPGDVLPSVSDLLRRGGGK